MEIIGAQLLTEYSMVFELVSVVLLIAILGAIILARKGRNN
jgi:NADH-quinone oxidoreductase subunit J